MNRPAVAARTANPELAALLLRVALGVLYLAHSLQKIFIFTLPGAAQFFVSVGFPGWLAYVTTFVELLGGIALLLGVQVRWVALVLLPFMLGALSVHFHNGWGFASPNGGWEYPAFWAVALVVQSLLGNGLFALGQARAPHLAGRAGA
jgi:putative oxidoreductase